MNKTRGVLVVFSGPSGVGKDTVLSSLLEKRDDIYVSVSATTRSMRSGETQGNPYTFVSKKEFSELIKENKVLEYASYCGNYYGTPAEPVEKMLSNGKNVILKIDVQGAVKVKKKIPEAALIFVAPPSFEVLKSRLYGRGTEDLKAVEGRLEAAKKELEAAINYDYIIINSDKEQAATELSAILDAEKCKTERRLKIIEGGY